MPAQGRDITLEDMKYYGELSKPRNGLNFYYLWWGHILLPKRFDTATGKDALGDRGSPRPHGPMDWDSVMLYNTREVYFAIYKYEVVNGVAQYSLIKGTWHLPDRKVTWLTWSRTSTR